MNREDTDTLWFDFLFSLCFLSLFKRKLSTEARLWARCKKYSDVQGGHDQIFTQSAWPYTHAANQIKGTLQNFLLSGVVEKRDKHPLWPPTCEGLRWHPMMSTLGWSSCWVSLPKAHEHCHRSRTCCVFEPQRRCFSFPVVSWGWPRISQLDS